MSKVLISAARELRKRSADTERLLWRHLRSRQFDGLKFRRQELIGKFIVDFVCYEKKVIIEADGGQHNEKGGRQNDQWRDQWFN